MGGGDAGLAGGAGVVLPARRRGRLGLAAEDAIPPRCSMPLRTVPPTFRAVLSSSAWEILNMPEGGTGVGAGLGG